MAEYHIPELYTKQSDFLGPPHKGLFCKKDLLKGNFIGFYTGVWYHDDVELSTEEEQYSVSTGEYVIVPDIDDETNKPNPENHIISMANEPVPNTSANAVMMEFEVAGHKVEDGVQNQTYNGLALIACKYIRAHTEITWYYGNKYKRGYPVGNMDGCKEILAQSTAAQHPTQVLSKIKNDAVDYKIESPVTSSSTSDEEWK